MTPIPEVMHTLAPETSSFILMAEGGTYVDKTYAIADFLKSGIQPIHLVLRGRHSGKTTLLHLFRAFFQHTDPADEARRRQLFLENKFMITGSTKFDSEFGRYPVLYIDLSSLIGLTIDNLMEHFGKLVYNIAWDMQSVGYFVGSEELAEGDQRFLHDALQRQLPNAQLDRALYNLTRIVAKLTKRRPIVLIDEYDTPTLYAVQNNYFAEANNIFLRIFLPLLKGNEHIRGALIVGIFQVAKAGWLSGVNNLRVFPSDVEKYSKAFMFTEKETRQLYDREVALRGDRDVLSFSFEDLKEWYNGYYASDGTRLYNPWSVGNALMSGNLRSYWVESGYDSVIQKRIYHFLNTDSRFRGQIANLLANKSTPIEINGHMTYESVADMSPTQLWTLMYYAGYLTKAPLDSTAHDADDSDSDDDGASSDTPSTSPGDICGTRILVRIPNFDVRSMFRQWLQDHINQSMEPEIMSMSVDLFRRMVSGDMSSFATEFGKLVWNTMPNRFLGRKEYVYQAYVSAYFTAAGEASTSLDRWNKSAWDVRVEHYGGIGRMDLILQRMGDNTGVLHRHKREAFKQRDKEEGYSASQRKRLTRKAEEALAQLETRQYRASMGDHVTKLHEYGLAFLGPYCAVVGHSLERRQGGWVIVHTYGSIEDEERRELLYTSQTS